MASRDVMYPGTPSAMTNYYGIVTDGWSDRNTTKSSRASPCGPRGLGGSRGSGTFYRGRSRNNAGKTRMENEKFKERQGKAISEYHSNQRMLRNSSRTRGYSSPSGSSSSRPIPASSWTTRTCSPTRSNAGPVYKPCVQNLSDGGFMYGTANGCLVRVLPSGNTID